MQFASLIEIFQKSTSPSPQELQKFLLAIDKSTLARWLISYGMNIIIEQHPNSFFKVRLITFPTGESLRLHIWLPESKADSNIHNHRWPFVSRLLSGSYEQTKFIIATGGNETKVRYNKSTKQETYHSSNVTSHANSVQHFSAGQAHALSPSEFHQIRNVSGSSPTMTLFVTGKAQSDHSYVIFSKPNPLILYPTVMDSSEANRLITKIVIPELLS